MNQQQGMQPRSSANGFGRRRFDREMGPKIESKMHTGKSTSSNFGLANGSKVGGFGSPSRDRLIFITTNLVGHPVEVHVKNGSIISGIFHASNVEKDFGIVLKMARVIKDGSVKGQKLVSDFVKRPQTMIIPARELVQVLAKDVPLNSDESTNGHARDKRHDLMIDSVISQSHHVDVERELKPWTPDKDDPDCPELENIFDGTWNRSWDQFETNEALFGVKSTFDEELYTTKIERGPQMKEREREAMRIAREIQEEETKDLHLAEERGINFHEDFDFDEEMRFSAVRRNADDGRFEETEDSALETSNTETFGGSLSSLMTQSYSDIARKRVNDEAQAASGCSSVDEEACSQIPTDREMCPSDSADHVTQQQYSKVSQYIDSNRRLDEIKIKNPDKEKTFLNDCTDMVFPEESQTVRSEEIQPLKSLSAKAATFLSPGEEDKSSPHEHLEPSRSGKLSTSTEPINPSLRPGSSTSSTSERAGAGSTLSSLGASPISSVALLSSEKSNLNPNAKEFKLNPNAKSFTPSALRPHGSVAEGSFYYTNNISAVPHMQSLPIGIGVGTSFGGPQPFVYNPQAAQMQSPQPYIHPNAPMYGQQMIIGQRPVVYMPTYPPDLPYKGRNF